MPSTASAANGSTPQPGVLVFISYAHADEPVRAALRKHFAALEREGLVQAWDDRQIPAGADFADEIDAQLNQADVILLLVSAEFISSEYCYGKELARAMERNADRNDRAIVIPIIVRRCDWEQTRFAPLQALPAGARPLAEWPTPDDYYTAVAKGLRQRLQGLVQPGGGPTGQPSGGWRKPRWWQRPGLRAAAAGLLLAGAAAGGWGWTAWQRAGHQVDAALTHLRSGRPEQAVAQATQACRAWVARNACFVLQKAALGQRLEAPETLQIEPFAAEVRALLKRAPDDPDLLFYAAQIALRENRPERHGPAYDDIRRAIEGSGGRFPEAYFYLASQALHAREPAQALQWLDRALDPAVNDAAPAHYLNARAYARARTGDLQGALQDYEQSAELGILVSRIELAELLWSLSDFERASDQLRAARRALGEAPQTLSGRNRLPWAFEVDGGRVVLRQPDEKRCFADWMLRAGLALAGQAEPGAAPDRSACGPEATRIALAVAASLRRASGGGMNDTGRERVLAFARQHRL